MKTVSYSHLLVELAHLHKVSFSIDTEKQMITLGNFKYSYDGRSDVSIVDLDGVLQCAYYYVVRNIKLIKGE